MIRIGTAGWAIPAAVRDAFPGEGAQLARYARIFSAAEINSSFHRPHRPATYARWSASVGDDFRFSVKLPKTITHQQRLVGAHAALHRFADEVTGLGPKLAVILVQLPPSLALDPVIAASFLRSLRALLSTQIVIEPRHPSWFDPEADRMLVDHQVGRVAADPATVPQAAQPGGWKGIAYARLHGSPRIYWSGYDAAAIASHRQAALAAAREADQVWVIYDNTASGAAAADALTLRHSLARIGTS